MCTKKLIFIKGDETRPKIENLNDSETLNESIFADIYTRAFRLIDEIAKRFGVTYQTARTDLMHLNALGYLWMRKRGKAQYYSVNSEWRENAGL